MKTSVIISPLQGYTGKDHLLPEIARQAQAQLASTYASVSSARRAAARAWWRVCRSRALYRGCEAGFALN